MFFNSKWRLLCLFFLIVISGQVDGLLRKHVKRTRQQHRAFIAQPPWLNVPDPADTKVHCLCGYLYKSVFADWQLVKDVLATTGCEKECKSKHVEVLPDVKKTCEVHTYTKTGSTPGSWAKDTITPTPAVPCTKFFPGGKTLTDWQNGYEKSDNVKILHFFWWGTTRRTGETLPQFGKRILDSAATIWATKLKDTPYRIKFWAQKELDLPAVATEYDNMDIMEIGGDTYPTLGDILTGTPMAASKDELNRIVNSLAELKQNVFIKDLVVPAIMYKFGGYYFDATVSYIGDDEDIVTKLDSGAKGGKCPVYPLYPNKGTLLVSDFPIDDDGSGVFYEVHSMYYPAGSKAAQQVVEGLIDTYTKQYITVNVAKPYCDKSLIHTFQGVTEDKRNGAIQTILGDLITSEVSRAIRDCMQDKLVLAKFLYWGSRLGDKVGLIDELGIQKEYKGGRSSGYDDVLCERLFPPPPPPVSTPVVSTPVVDTPHELDSNGHPVPPPFIAPTPTALKKPPLKIKTKAPPKIVTVTKTDKTDEETDKDKID